MQPSDTIYLQVYGFLDRIIHSEQMHNNVQT